MIVTVTGGQLAGAEQDAYVDYLQSKHGRKLDKLEIELDGEFANLSYTFTSEPFERIRRITGYLGKLDRWNDAKTAEERDRIKHAVN